MNTALDEKKKISVCLLKQPKLMFSVTFGAAWEHAQDQ